MNKLILGAIIASLMHWSTLIFAHNPDVTRHPLTLTYGLLKGHSCIGFVYHKQTLKDLYEQGNPLKLPSWREYHDELREKTAPHGYASYTNEEASLWSSGLFEIKNVCFFNEDNRERFFKKIKKWIGSNELAPFVDDRTRQDILNLGDDFQRSLVYELIRYGLPISLIPPVVTHVLSCGDNIRKALVGGPSPSYRFASWCHDQGQTSDLILAGDVEMHEVQSIEHQGQPIVGIYLDNRLPFKERFDELGCGAIKFQLVLGFRLLCCCEEGTPSHCCGGFDLAAKDRPILKFLDNVTSVLDETAASIAVLSGYNPIEPHGVEDDVLTFNQTAGDFEAKIFRNEFGEFHGILIQKRQACAQILPADDEKKAPIAL